MKLNILTTAIVLIPLCLATTLRAQTKEPLPSSNFKAQETSLKTFPNPLGAPPDSVPQREPRNITGTYTFKSQLRTGVLAVNLLPSGKIKFYLNATYSPPGNPGGTNTGEVSSVVPLKGNTAVYLTQECKISLEFLSQKVVVKQQGSCGLGLKVLVDSTYIRCSTKTPQLDNL